MSRISPKQSFAIYQQMMVKILVTEFPANRLPTKGMYMAKTLNKLSPLTIKSMAASVKKEGKTEKAADGGGLYYIAEPNRSSWWRGV